MLITNLLISLELKFERNILYSELIPGLERKIDADWILTDSGILIEYFGLYIEKQLHQENFIGRYTRNALDKINLCEEHNITLIDLYPEDREDIEEVLIRKLLEHQVI